MRFANHEEKLNWLKSCADKLRQLECQRRIAIVAQDYGRAFDLLRAYQFGRRQFATVSRTLRPKTAQTDR